MANDAIDCVCTGVSYVCLHLGLCQPYHPAALWNEAYVWWQHPSSCQHYHHKVKFKSQSS